MCTLAAVLHSAQSEHAIPHIDKPHQVFIWIISQHLQTLLCTLCFAIRDPGVSVKFKVCLSLVKHWEAALKLKLV